MSRYFADANGTEMDDARCENPFGDDDHCAECGGDLAPGEDDICPVCSIVLDELADAAAASAALDELKAELETKR